MRARSTVRRVIPGAAAFGLSCAVLAGCAATGGSSPGAASSGAPSRTAATGSTHTGKLTGNFCTDLVNIGANLPIPASASGSLAAQEQHDGRYLREVAAYYSKLAAEAPPQIGQEIRHIVTAYRGLASSIASGTTHSLSKIEQQITSLTSSGAAASALKQLVIYVTSKCA